MPTHPIYDQLLDKVTGAIERQVLHILFRNAGLKTTRQQLVLAVFGKFIPANQLAVSVEDRKIRECIERLRQEWPIVSSSGEAGYILEDDEERIREFAAEQESRAEKNRQSARQAYTWLPKARSIRAARRGDEKAVQPALLEI